MQSGFDGGHDRKAVIDWNNQWKPSLECNSSTKKESLQVGLEGRVTESRMLYIYLDRMKAIQ